MFFSKYFVSGEMEFFASNDNFPSEFFDETFWLDLIP